MGPYTTAKLLLDSTGSPVIMSGTDQEEDVTLVASKRHPVTGRISLSGGVIAPTVNAGNTAIIIGDSIAAAYWFPLMTVLSGSKIRMVRNAGVAGQNSNAILSRMASDVIAYSPSWCVIEGITPNDPGQAVTQAQSILNVKAMVAACVAAGIYPLICLCLPSDIARNRDHMLSVAVAISEWANKSGYPTIDLYTPVCDPVDGTYLAAMTVDGTHLSAAGERAIADYNVTRLPAAFRQFNLLQVAANDPTNKVVNGLFQTDTNADGLADSWTKYGTGTSTLSAVAAGEGSGNWQVLAPGGVVTQLEQWITTVIGNTYELSLRCYATGVATLRIRGFGGDLTGDFSVHGAITSASGAVGSRRFVAIATSTQLLLGASGASGTVGFGQVTVRDLTALGVA